MLKLHLQVVLLPMPTHPPIQDKEPPIYSSDHPLDLCARNARLTTDLYDPDASGFNPAPHGHRMQTEFMGGCSDPQEFLSRFCHQDLSPLSKA